MRRKMKLLIAASTLVTIAAGLFAPLYAIFVERIGGSVVTAGTAYGAFSIVSGLLILLISRWEDRVKHQEKLIVVGELLGSMLFLGYLFVATPAHLYLIQVLFGVRAAIIYPAYDGLFSNYLDKGKYTSQWGTWEAIVLIASAIAAFIGGYVVEIYGFRLLFVGMFALSLMSLGASLLLLRE